MDELRKEKVVLQAWDQEDYRLARFERSPKQVNPNIAMHLIAEQPPKPCEDRVVWCDGGHEALGHPRVYINLVSNSNDAFTNRKEQLIVDGDARKSTLQPADFSTSEMEQNFS